MELYKLKFDPMQKSAATTVPSDPGLWPAEVLRAVVSEHPYVDTSQIKIRFSQLEPESKIASGNVLVQNAVAIPFTIRKDDSRNKYELDSLDVLFDGKKFAHLNEDSLRRAIDGQQVGSLVKKKELPPGNRYVGDLTGDVTPLEWSGYPTGFSGARPVTAGMGLLSYVIKNNAMLGRLKNMLVDYNGINSATAELGLNDSLEALQTGLVEDIETVRMAHVMRKKGGGFAVAFDNGDTRAISAKDLRRVMGPDFGPVMRQVMSRGWAFVRDFPVVRDADVGTIGPVPQVIEQGGLYQVFPLDGSPCTAVVSSKVVDFDGANLTGQKAVCLDGSYWEGKALVGVSVPSIACRPKDKYVQERLVTEHMPFEGRLPFPVGVLDTGAKGCFIDESFGSPKFTPTVVVNQIISMPNEPDIYICTRTDTKTKVGLVVLPSIVRPQRIPDGHFDKRLLPENSFYLPAHMSFVKCTVDKPLMDKAVNTVKTASEQRPAVEIHKNANRYYVRGTTLTGKWNDSMLEEEQMRQKLAWHGASDEVIEKVASMRTGDRMNLYGLRTPVSIKKEAASVEFPEGLMFKFRVAAREALEGVEETLHTKNAADLKDPKLLDAVLAMQFVSDEALEDIAGSEDIFSECEDKLARLLLASRQGHAAIHEKGVQKALKGIGQARSSLKELKMTLNEK